ncbi:MAG: N-acetylmuramoyl-L-alanine amidase family protein, partial [Acetobacteraceae bacterium]
MNLFWSRRVLLRRIGEAIGVFGTFLLPVDPAEAAQRRTRRPSGQLGHAPLIMLDPGHGGKDPGAIGVSGTYEKHIALAAALELRHLFEAGGRY